MYPLVFAADTRLVEKASEKKPHFPAESAALSICDIFASSTSHALVTSNEERVSSVDQIVLHIILNSLDSRQECIATLSAARRTREREVNQS